MRLISAWISEKRDIALILAVIESEKDLNYVLEGNNGKNSK